jgi:hypothetical protein
MAGIPNELLAQIANPQGPQNVLAMFAQGSQQGYQNQQMGRENRRYNALIEAGDQAAVGNYEGAAANAFHVAEHNLGKDYISMAAERQRDAELRKILNPEQMQGPPSPNSPPMAVATGSSPRAQAPFSPATLAKAGRALQIGGRPAAEKVLIDSLSGGGGRPATAQEKVQWGVKAEDPLWFDGNGEPHMLTSSTNIDIDMTGETEEAKKLGGFRAERLDALEAGKSISQLRQIQLIGKLMEGVDTGALANIEGKAGNIIASLGLPVESLNWLGIDPNLVTTGPAIQGLINRQVVGMIGGGQFPAQNFSDTDRIFLEKIFPSLTNQPGANRLITATAERLLELESAKLKAWTQARKQKISFRDFEADWNDKLQGLDLFGDIAKQAGMSADGEGDNGWSEVPGMPGVTIRKRGQ